MSQDSLSIGPNGFDSGGINTQKVLTINDKIVGPDTLSVLDTGTYALGVDSDGNWKITEDGGTTWSIIAAPGTVSGWTDDGTTVRLTTATDAVGVGTATVIANRQITMKKSGTLTGIALSDSGAADNLVEHYYISTDANPAFSIVGDGSMAWGLGGATAVDTKIGRGAANRLDLGSGDSMDTIGAALFENRALTPDVNPRMSLGSSAFAFGDGGASAVDTKFGRTTGFPDRLEGSTGDALGLLNAGFEIRAATADANTRATLDAGGLSFRPDPTSANIRLLLDTSTATPSLKLGAGGAGGAIDTRFMRSAAKTMRLDDGAGGAADFFPGADGVGRIGAAGSRWGLVRAVTITSGKIWEEEVFAEEDLDRNGKVVALRDALIPTNDRHLGVGRHLPLIAMATAQTVVDLADELDALRARLALLEAA